MRFWLIVCSVSIFLTSCSITDRQERKQMKEFRKNLEIDRKGWEVWDRLIEYGIAPDKYKYL